MNSKTLLIATAVASALLCSSVREAHAEQRQKGFIPSRAAIAACKGKNVGDSVTYTENGKELIGTCTSLFGFVLYAKPIHNGGLDGISPQAILACFGKKEGDQVSYTDNKGQQIKGTCTKQQWFLYAKPNVDGGDDTDDGDDGDNGGDDGTVPPFPIEAIKACEGVKEGERVSYIDKNGKTIKGVCTFEQGVLYAKPEVIDGGNCEEERELERQRLKPLLEACKGQVNGSTVTYIDASGKTIGAICEILDPRLVAKPIADGGDDGDDGGDVPPPPPPKRPIRR